MPIPANNLESPKKSKVLPSKDSKAQLLKPSRLNPGPTRISKPVPDSLNKIIEESKEIKPDQGVLEEQMRNFYKSLFPNSGLTSSQSTSASQKDLPQQMKIPSLEMAALQDQSAGISFFS